jgi:hypothetical protein
VAGCKSLGQGSLGWASDMQWEVQPVTVMAWGWWQQQQLPDITSQA